MPQHYIIAACVHSALHLSTYTGPYAGGVRGGSDEPSFWLGSYVIDSHLARLDLSEIAG